MRKLFYSLLGLLVCGACMSFAESLPETITIPGRIGAYSPDAARRLMGFFPAGASLKVLDSETHYLSVEYTSPSGQTTAALVRRSDVGLPTEQTMAQLPVPSLGTKEPWAEKAFGEFDERHLTEQMRSALTQEGFNWEHAETPHFVLHYEHGIFARKVARMAEFYYDYIATDLKGPEDRYPGRSHIIIYRTPERWLTFMKELGPPEMQWAFAFVSGPSLFLQQAQNTRSSAGVLAHEMTHLILNRFFQQQPPAWLNEGLAEWYGEFAYSSYKGTKKSRRTVFQPIKDIIPLETLMKLESYPEDREAVSLFYLTSKYLVGYLRIRHPEEDFQPFMVEVLKGKDPWSLMQSMYGYEDMDHLTRKFKTFANVR